MRSVDVRATQGNPQIAVEHGGVAARMLMD